MFLKTPKTDGSTRASESGNVLFLILIAVALFAALSYAVTQSTRTGGGSGDNETALISSAQLTQYPASIRTAVVRMIIGGVDNQNLEFIAPANFADCTGASATPPRYEFCVFHPEGGGATYTTAPANLMADGQVGSWYFNANFEIEEIGTSVDGNDAGNEIIAFLPSITQTLCFRINEELGITNDAGIVSDTDLSSNTTGYQALMDDTYSFPGDELDIGSATAMPNLVGQPFGCFQDNADPDGDGTNDYVYYHVLLEK